MTQSLGDVLLAFIGGAIFGGAIYIGIVLFAGRKR